MTGRMAGQVTADGAIDRLLVTVRVVDLTDPTWDVACAAADLRAAERARADRGVPAVRRRRVLVRSALRRVLGDLLGLPARAVPLQDDHGRPVLPGSGLGLSCSANDGVALVAVASGVAIGVDVERLGDEDPAVATEEGWLAPEEQARLGVLPEPVRSGAVTRCWTQKEAVLKARGTGIRRPPCDVVTPVADTGRVGPWWVAPIPVPAGHLASLASDVPLTPDQLGVVPLTPGDPR
jgi:4'-phosphopantetheinyl transferase